LFILPLIFAINQPGWYLKKNKNFFSPQLAKKEEKKSEDETTNLLLLPLSMEESRLKRHFLLWIEIVLFSYNQISPSKSNLNEKRKERKKKKKISSYCHLLQ